MNYQNHGNLDGLGIAWTISRSGIKTSFDKRASMRLKQNETKQDKFDQGTEIIAIRFWDDRMYSILQRENNFPRDLACDQQTGSSTYWVRANYLC